MTTITMESVNAADYTVWRDALSGGSGISLAADGNQDGLIDSADYQVWLDNYGAILMSAHPLPLVCLSQAPQYFF